jgi:hypothetical protein
MNAARIASIVGITATVLVIIAFWVSFARERELGLMKHLERGMAAGAFPYALLMIYGGAFDPGILLQTSGITFLLLRVVLQSRMSQ